jgi:hypothetical protein
MKCLQSLYAFSLSRLSGDTTEPEGEPKGIVVIIFSKPTQNALKQALITQLIDRSHIMGGNHIVGDYREIADYKLLSCNNRHTEYWHCQDHTPSDQNMHRLNAHLRDQTLYTSTSAEYGLDGRTFTIFDNLMYDRTFFQKAVVKSAFVNAKKSKRMVILHLNSPIVISHCILQSMDYVFLYHTMNVGEISRMYNQFAIRFQFFPFTSFLKLVQNLTPCKECLVIAMQCTSTSNDIRDHLFVFKNIPIYNNRSCKL